MEIGFSSLNVMFTLFQLILEPEVRYELKHGDHLVLADVKCLYSVLPRVRIRNFEMAFEVWCLSITNSFI